MIRGLKHEVGHFEVSAGKAWNPYLNDKRTETFTKFDFFTWLFKLEILTSMIRGLKPLDKDLDSIDMANLKSLPQW